MVKRFVLNWIRKYMSHEYARRRNEIFRAINEGCAKAFREDNTQTRLSWMVGELVKNDPEFMRWLEENHHVTGHVAGAIFDEISGIVSHHNKVRTQQKNYAAKQLIRNRK